MAIAYHAAHKMSFSPPPVPQPITQMHTDLLLVELTLVLLRDRRDMMESPQLTTVPLLMLNVRNRYRSSLWRGLYGRSGSEQTRGRT